MRNQFLPDMYLQAQSSLGTQNAISGSFFPLPGLYNVNGSETGSASDHETNLFGSVMMDWKFLQFGRQKKSLESAKIFSNQAMHRLDAEQLTIQAELGRDYRSEEHTSELQSLMRISYAVFCLKKKTKQNITI